MRKTDDLDEYQYNNRIFEKVPQVNPELTKALQGLKETSPATDKNTETSLMQLRWELYEAIDKFGNGLGKAMRLALKMEVERLFKEHTNS
jgi:hypothetical protein